MNKESEFSCRQREGYFVLNIHIGSGAQPASYLVHNGGFFLLCLTATAWNWWHICD